MKKFITKSGLQSKFPWVESFFDTRSKDYEMIQDADAIIQMARESLSELMEDDKRQLQEIFGKYFTIVIDQDAPNILHIMALSPYHNELASPLFTLIYDINCESRRLESGLILTEYEYSYFRLDKYNPSTFAYKSVEEMMNCNRFKALFQTHYNECYGC